MAGNKQPPVPLRELADDEALGAGEWWRGTRDKWFGDCTARAASALQRRPRTAPSASTDPAPAASSQGG